MPSVGQRQVEIGVLVDVLLTVGSVVLAVGTVTGAVTVVAVGLLFGNILLALCSPEDSEYVIVGCDATATVEFCAGLITTPCSAASAWVMAFPPVIGVPEAFRTCKVLEIAARIRYMIEATGGKPIPISDENIAIMQDFVKNHYGQGKD